jgi:hypothetical protein
MHGTIISSVRDRAAAAACGLALVAAALVGLRAQTPTAEAHGAKIWIGRAAEMESYLAKAEIDRVEGTSVGVTRPRHVFLKAGGPFAEMTWKPLAPGMYGGYRESYKSEIAAYEIDRLLELDMVPPTIERTIDGEVGAAVMWINGARTFKELGGAPRAPERYLASWNRQLVRAKMFDDLIGNPDPNLGNWLVDAEWNVILIDHSRALVTGTKLTHELTRVHEDLWNRMVALSEQQLVSSPAGRWLDRDQIRAMLERREKMQKVVADLVKRKASAAYVP